METLEVFFDYICPYCLKAQEFLKELVLPKPEIHVLWRPCESHPRPESWGPHSDLCIQGYLFALDHHADLWEYHDRMFRAAQKDGVPIEDADALSECVKGLLDPDAFRKALKTGVYRTRQLALNDYAYEKSGVWAVPAYRMGGRRLDAVEDVGVTRDQLARFLNP